jgi:hypothetical protein
MLLDERSTVIRTAEANLGSRLADAARAYYETVTTQALHSSTLAVLDVTELSQLVK